MQQKQEFLHARTTVNLKRNSILMIKYYDSSEEESTEEILIIKYYDSS